MKLSWKYRQLVLFLVTLSVLFSLFFIVYQLKGVLFPFILGLILAYILLPLIRNIEKRIPTARFVKARRIALISAIYLIFLGIFTALSVLTFSSLRTALTTVTADAPLYWESVYNRLTDSLFSFTDLLLRNFPVETQIQVREYIYDFGLSTVNSFVGNIDVNNSSFTLSAISTIFGVVVMPIFLFYILEDWEKIGREFFSLFPSSMSEHAKHIVEIIDKVMGRFFRAQLFLGLIVGLMTLTGLLIMKVPFAILLAVIAGIGEVVPTYGPWVATIIAAFITLAIDPDKTLLVIMFFGGVQLLENLFLVPRIRGGFLNIHPALALVLLALGGSLGGITGTLLILPATATLAKIYKHIKYAVATEPKGTTSQDFTI